LRLLCAGREQPEALVRKQLRVIEADDADLAAVSDLIAVLRRDRAVAGDENVGVVLVELDDAIGAADPISLAGDEFAVGVAGEGAVARVTLPARRVDDEEAVARNGNVKRAAGVLQRALREIGKRCAILHEGDAAIRQWEMIGARRRGKIFLEADALAFEAVGVEVGKIIGNDVELALQRYLPRQSDQKGVIHARPPLEAASSPARPHPFLGRTRAKADCRVNSAAYRTADLIFGRQEPSGRQETPGKNCRR